MIEISPFQHAWSNLLLFFWSGICYTVALLFWPYFYSAKFESSSWQATPGKLLMGLRVTSNKGDRLSFSTIVWKRIGQISVLFIVSLASILFSARLTLSFGKNSVLEFLVPASPFIACFILSLFSFKGKNLLNLFSNSVNRLDDAGRQEQRKRLRFTELCKTVMTTSTGKPEWLLLLCTAWACYAWYGTFAGCYQICSAMSEMNRAFANTQDERLIKQDSHYLQATSMVHNLGSWYYYLALLHKHTGDWPAARDELRKSIILSPNPTFAHNSLAMLLLERGELKSAASELEKSISWRNYYYQHPNYMIQPATQSELSLSQLKFGDHGSECAFPLSCLR